MPTTDTDLPGGTPQQTQTVEATGVAIDGTGATTIGTAVGENATVTEVRVDSGAQDFDFNVEHNGDDLFDGEQSPTDAEESFVPDQNSYVGENSETVIDVSSASASGSATADVQVVVEYTP